MEKATRKRGGLSGHGSDSSLSLDERFHVGAIAGVSASYLQPPERVVEAVFQPAQYRGLRNVALFAPFDKFLALPTGARLSRYHQSIHLGPQRALRSVIFGR